MTNEPSDLVVGPIRQEPGVVEFIDSTGDVIYVGQTKSVEDYLYNLKVRLRYIWDIVELETTDISVTYTSTYSEANRLGLNIRRIKRPRYNTTRDTVSIRIEVTQKLAEEVRQIVARDKTTLTKWVTAALKRQLET